MLPLLPTCVHSNRMYPNVLGAKVCRTCCGLISLVAPSDGSKHNAMDAPAARRTEPEAGMARSGGALIKRVGTGMMARRTTTVCGALSTPRKLVTVSWSSNRWPPSSCVRLSVTEAADFEVAARRAVITAALSQVRGKALQLYVSERTPPKLRVPSRVKDAPLQLSISSGAWMKAVGLRHSSRSGVSLLSHG